jgi:hypothetical protein
LLFSFSNNKIFADFISNLSIINLSFQAIQLNAEIAGKYLLQAMTFGACSNC